MDILSNIFDILYTMFSSFGSFLRSCEFGGINLLTVLLFAILAFTTILFLRRFLIRD